MERLVTSLSGPPAPDAMAAWSAQGTLRPVAGAASEVWLRLQASVAVMLQCQRCLRPMAAQIAIDRRMRFVANESEAARLDEESDDDVLVLPPRLDLHELLEDELILALPIVPRHDEPCPEPLPLAPGAGAADDEAPHPFAALAALRGRTPRG